MRYAAIKNYVREHADAIKNAALTGLAAIVLATGGCARTAGGKLTLGQLEWGDKTVMSRDKEIQKIVIESDAKYEDTASVVPGKGLGISYKKE